MLNLSHSQLRCLLTVYELEGENDPIASKEIAVQMHVSRPSVHRLLEGLISRGLIRKEPYGDVFLSEKGREAARELSVLRTRGGRAFRRCFAMEREEADRAVLCLLSGVDRDTAEKIAAAGEE